MHILTVYFVTDHYNEQYLQNTLLKLSKNVIYSPFTVFWSTIGLSNTESSSTTCKYTSCRMQKLSSSFR